MDIWILKYSIILKTAMKSGMPVILEIRNYHKKNNLLHMNPGAAGKHGFHKFRTILRFSIIKDKVNNLEAIELGLRSSID